MRHIVIMCVATIWLAGCSVPGPQIGLWSEQDLPEDAMQRDMRPDPAEAEGGLLSRLLGGTRPEAADLPDGQDAPAEAGANVPEETQAETSADEAQDAAAAPAPRPRGGVFALLGLEAGTPPEPSAPTATSEIAFGTVLPYGRLAVICDVPTHQMGEKIAAFPEGRGTFGIYDSDPGNTAAHTFYLTGFADGCARQFTASLAVFGSVKMHEKLRYGLPAEVQPYSDTDKAYEMLKAQVCEVPKRAPCGDRISRLERDTVFVSIYERFGDNAHWKNVLLHDGTVLAQDLKGG